ncbi:MAG: TIGR00303 family protein, partial [Gloeomargaritaceae cyanobacterium C42_A2020_066]|nr:TIGR00303 family protein [Gloeomargaritaceae cyanobacterium C42_A2020_066]
QGRVWGTWLARTVGEGYLVLGECVVGGTTTALAVLTGLGIEARNRVNSSHPHCNHDQKWAVVCQGLAAAELTDDPLSVVAAVGDPMQVVAAGLALAVSGLGRGVLLAGGTQMLAVWALAKALADYYGLPWRPEELMVGTTRWVAADPTGDTPGLAAAVGAPLIAADLNFSSSRYASLRAYEQGFVKEGVAAGGCALAAHLTANWSAGDLLARVEALLPTVSTPPLSQRL